MRSGLGDLVFLELIIEGAAANPQELGCLLLVPATLFQHFFQQLSLMLYQGWCLPDRGGSGGGSMECRRQVRGFDPSPFGQNCGVFNRVFQFTDIARPRVIQEQPEDLRAEALNFFALFCGKKTEKMASKQGYVITPFTE